MPQVDIKAIANLPNNLTILVVMSCLFYKANGHIADISIDSLYTDIDMRTYKYPTNEHAVKDSFYYSTLSS